MNVKQVIIVRSDLRNEKNQKIRTGKIAAQVAHASQAFIINNGEIDKKGHLSIKLSKEELDWIDSGHTKICVSCDSEEELVELYNKAKKAKLTVEMITDSGRTEFNGVATKTCIAIGPNYSSEIDEITKHLKLL